MEMKNSTMSSRFKSVCVYGGSRSGKLPCYKESSVELAKELVARKIDLVYGGETEGLVGSLSQAALDGGRSVTRVIPRTLKGKEVTGETVEEAVAVADMHERKAKMARLADCFIALPGGFGTLQELFEGISWAQLGIHDKPVGLLNVNGYFDSLLEFIDDVVASGFVKPSQRNILVSAPNAKKLLDKLEEYVPMHEGALPKKMWEIGK